jgi:CheY-like chemotaxis protein
MDGFEASTKMRQLEESQSHPRQRSKIIAITALSGDEHRERGLNEWVQKVDSEHAANACVVRQMWHG